MCFFKMKLEDESGKSLEAHVSGKDAVTILSGVPPTNFYRNQIQRYTLLEILYDLTGDNKHLCFTVVKLLSITDFSH